MPGRRIGKFELLEELGQGGMGVVYRARDVRLDRLVALKLMRADRAPDESSRARFLRECRAVAALNHPNIAALYEADETEDGTLYFAAELVAGQTLADHLREGPVPLDRALDWARQLAAALAGAHAKGIVHRDIKPPNVMIGPEGRLKVLDFGLARRGADPDAPTLSATSHGADLSRAAGHIVGTPGYMAPEQVRGEITGPPADVFAAGVVFYELLTGSRPFGGDNVEARLQQVLNTTPRPVVEVNRHVPRAVAALVMVCLEKSPTARFADGGELARALDEATGHRTRAPWLPWGAAAGVALAAGALWWGTRDTLAFTSQDHLLVADVVNTTDEPLFGGALGTALEVDLRQSRYALVVSRREIAEALQLTRRAPETTIDLDTALDLARWVGAEAVVVPSIARVGDGYRLEATLYATDSASPVDRVGVDAPSRDAVLRDAVDELTGALRARLGEALGAIGQTDAPVVKATTSSWEALEAFRLGTAAFDAGRPPEAVRFLEEALAHDPEFAAARGQLALLLIQFMDQPDRGRQLLSEAANAADRLTNYERVMLQALARQFVDGDLDGAIEGFRMAASLFPDRSEPYQNQGIILRARGQFADAATAFREAAARSPKSAGPLMLLWFLEVGPVRDPQGAEQTARRLQALRPADQDYAHTVAWSLIAQQRFADAEAALRAIVELAPGQARARINLAHLVLRRGEAAGAADRYQAILDEARSGQLQTDPAPLVLWKAIALRRAGRNREADLAFDEAAEQASTPASRALVAAARGRADEATSHLSQLPPVENLDYRTAQQVAAVRAWLGDLDAAVRALRRALDLNSWDVYYHLILPELLPLADHPPFVRLIAIGQ